MIDLHCDILTKLTETNGTLVENAHQFDIRRAAQAGLFMEFFALFTRLEGEAGWQHIGKQMALLHEAVGKEPALALIQSYEDVAANRAANCFSGVLHLEDGAVLDGSDDKLEQCYQAGLRSLGLTWNYRNGLADGVGVEDGRGLTKAGRHMINALSQRHMALDLAHISNKGFYEAVELYPQPVLVTHANAYAICPHRRNLNDQQLKVLADHGGIVGITLVADFVAPLPLSQVTIDHYLDHFVHIAGLIGPEYLALGSDFDGAEDMVLSGVEGYENLDSQLAGRGFSPKEIAMIKKENVLRTLKNIF